MRRLADELFKAQKDMQTIRKETKKRKQPHREEQELVQEEVKESLRSNDSQNCVQRVHMTQEGSEWVCYLRCKVHAHRERGSSQGHARSKQLRAEPPKSRPGAR